ncbi:MAG TPA: ATP-dependent zinc metalloprotease FtsH [Acidimicrobiales bacterium]|nr:ATP-dependent zinc metalloprotease FtsH [Acidimicrobiales bacterium]
MKKVLRSPVVWALLAVIFALLLFDALRSGPSQTTLGLGDYESDLGNKTVATAIIHDGSDSITGKLRDGTSYVVQYPDRLTQPLTDKIIGSGASVKVSHSKSNPWITIFLENYLPIILIVGLFLFAVNSMQGGGSRVMQFGKARARTAGKDQPKVTFSDVAGTDEAVAELQEIKEFLEAPGRFQALGAKIPKGVLLFGPPGTGKTLLARAVAGEAGVPFFSISGSDFVEMFVGVGASRVRDLFEQAKANAPAIVFMDEIDAVGRHRGAGLGGGHDEREQTLNQLLVEMDGFDVRGGVILIAATNRPDILDPALLRPGRFDRQIVVDRPDLVGRRQILAVHAKGKPLSRSADLDVLAKRTPGFTGADLANLLNEAAILAARRNIRQIGMRECEEAIDRVLAGPERKTLVMSEHDKLVTAYHEAGHAIVGHVLAHADPIHKVSIVARSRSLGLTFTLPEDRYNHSRSQLRDMMAMSLGGRTAEELVFSEPTTGAENDIEKVTRIARAMVTEYGMSEELGPQQLGHRDGEVFLGRELGHQANYSQEVAAKIDREVRGLIDEAHGRARAVLTHHRSTLDLMARELVEKETLDSMDLAGILGPLGPWPPGKPARPAAASGANGKRSNGRGGAGTPIPAKPAVAPKPAEAASPGRKRRPLSAPGRAPVGAATRSQTPSAMPAQRRRQPKKTTDEPAASPAPRPRPRPKPGTQQ